MRQLYNSGVYSSPIRIVTEISDDGTENNVGGVLVLPVFSIFDERIKI